MGAGLSGLAAAHWFVEQDPVGRVQVLEREPEPLGWLDRWQGRPFPLGLAERGVLPAAEWYPRGWPLLERVLEKWPAGHNRDWLADLGVPLEAGECGLLTCPHPESFREALLAVCRHPRIDLRTECAVEAISPLADGGFRIWSRQGDQLECRHLLMATGGGRSHGLSLSRELGHEVEIPEAGFLRLRLSSPKMGSRLGPLSREGRIRCLASEAAEKGWIELSARGLEGPAVSTLSARLQAAWRKRPLPLLFEVDWVPEAGTGMLAAQLGGRGRIHGRRPVGEDPLFGFTPRQWDCFLSLSGIDPGTSWARLKQRKAQSLAQQLKHFRLSVSGLALPSGERAWAGGVGGFSVDWNSLQSTRVPGLYFTGEILDFLGLPGGPHLHAVWATAHLSGSSMGRS